MWWASWGALAFSRAPGTDLKLPGEGVPGAGRSLQRVLVPAGNGANWGKSSCRSGQAEGASELRRPGHPVLQHVNRSVLCFPSKTLSACLYNLLPLQAANFWPLGSCGEVQVPTCPSPGCVFRAEEEPAPTPSCGMPAQTT